MKRPIFAVIVSALLLAGCQSSATAPQTVTVHDTPSSSASSDSSSSESPDAPTAEAATPADAEPATAVMPDVVCMNLQDAQDLIQTKGVFYSRSEDATGAGRLQILDRNWIVVSQTPGAGAKIGEGDAVLSVVKIGEPSSC